MESFKEKLAEWEWSDTWLLLLLLLALSALAAGGVIGITAAFADKHVDGYYIEHHGDDSKTRVSACVYAHWTWEPDRVAFCTDDVNKALDFMSRANAAIRAR